MSKTATDRICKVSGCNTVLNSYNKGLCCAAHISVPAITARLGLCLDKKGEIEDVFFVWWDDPVGHGVNESDLIIEIKISNDDWIDLEEVGNLLNEKSEETDLPNSLLLTTTIPELIIRALKENGYLKKIKKRKK